MMNARCITEADQIDVGKDGMNAFRGITEACLLDNHH